MIIVEDTTAPTWITAANALDRVVELCDEDALLAAQALEPEAYDNCDTMLILDKTSVWTEGIESDEEHGGSGGSGGHDGDDGDDGDGGSGGHGGDEGHDEELTCIGAGTYTNTWKVLDHCSNEVVQVYTQVITVQDSTPPELTIPANVSIECDEDSTPTGTGTATATDNCDSGLIPVYTDLDCFGITKEKEISAGNPGNGSNGGEEENDGDEDSGSSEGSGSNGNNGNNGGNGGEEEDKGDKGGGVYLPFDVSGMANLGINSIKNFNLTFETKWGKGKVEFILVAPNGKGIVLVGPYCEDGYCVDDDPIDELYSPTFYPNSSGYDAWNNSDEIAEGDGNFTPNGGPSVNSESITGLNNGLVTSFEALTDGMESLDGHWFVFAKKQGVKKGKVKFISSCLTPDFGGFCASNDIIIRKWSVTDACGNSATGNQIIVISDTTAPVATGSITDTIIAGCSVAAAPAAVTTVADLEALTGDLSISDNCSAFDDLTVSSSDERSGTCPIIITRTYKVTDECSNESEDIIHTIKINDTTNPTGTAPADITGLQRISDVPDPNTEDVTNVSDNCSAPIITFVKDENNGATGCLEDPYIVTRTYKIADACNNFIEVTQTITVEDTTPPTVSAGTTTELNCNVTTFILQGSAVSNKEGGSNLTYQWSTTDGTIDSDGATLTPTISAPGTYVLTVTEENGCNPISDSVEITQDITKPVVVINSETLALTCSVSSITLDAGGTPVQGEATYLWSTGATTASIVVDQAGDYTVTVTDSDNGCSDALTIGVTENYESGEVAGGSVALCITEASFNLTTLLGSDYVSGGTWTGDIDNDGFNESTFDFDPSVVNLGDYEFTYTEPGDCGRMITVAVNVNDDCVVLACSTEDMLISKVVTPNNDGFNDNFEITGLEGCDFTFGVKIFNRWGKIVYQSENYQNNWSGRQDGSGTQIGSNNELPAGTYYYILTVSGGSGFRPMTGYIYLGTH